MGLSPYLCKVVKRKSKDTHTIYPLMDHLPYEVSRGFFNMCRQYEGFLLLQKFHNYIRLTDYDELVDVYRIKSKYLKDLDKAIEPVIDIVESDSSNKYMVEVYLPDNKNGYNYMQILHNTATKESSSPCDFKLNKVIQVDKSIADIKIKAHTLYYKEIEYLDFKFSSYKHNLPDWFFPYGYIVDNSKLVAYINYLDKKSNGYKNLKNILDRGGLKDDEFIDLGY